MNSYDNSTAAPGGAYDNTGYNAGAPAGGAQAYGGMPDTGKHGVNQGPADKIANMIPGHNTGAPGSMPGSNNPSHHEQQQAYGSSTTAGAGTYGDNSAYGAGGNSAYGGNTTTGTTGLAGHHHAGATPMTSDNAYNQPPREGPADKVANMIPGEF
ncbi:hypothetical protein OIV83_004051 [Microbotryomycetes sp. JL201]|nr:hypothetical protein OIV83_004051 [Microbotryomycetes sp. JL201]